MSYQKFIDMGLLSPTSRSDAAWMGLANLGGQLMNRGAPRLSPTPPPIDLGSVMQTYQNAMQGDLQRALALRQLEREDKAYEREQGYIESLDNMLKDVPLTVGEPATGQTVMQTQPSPLARSLGSALPLAREMVKGGQAAPLLSAVMQAAITPKSYDIKKIGRDRYAQFDKTTGNLTPLAQSGGRRLSGTGMTQQSTNALLDLGPKIADGSATKQEQQLYSIAHDHLGREKTETRIGNDGSKIIVRVPGADLSNFPLPSSAASPSTTASPSSPAAQPAREKVVSEGLPAKPTGEEQKASGFAARMEFVEPIMRELTADGNMPFLTQTQVMLAELPTGDYLQNISMTAAQQEYATAAREWIRAKLRKESGAAIPPDEMKGEYKTYFPLPGDSPETIEFKRKLRETNTKEMRAAAAGSDLYRRAVEQKFPKLGKPTPAVDNAQTAEDLKKKFGLK